MDRYAYSNVVFISRSQMPSASMIREEINKDSEIFQGESESPQIIGGVHKGTGKTDMA